MVTASFTVPLSFKCNASTSSRLLHLFATARSKMLCVSATKSLLAATKSVSHFKAIIAPKPSTALTNTQPLDASRSERFAAIAWPRLRMISTAVSISPLASAKAFLQSPRPAPVKVRSFLMSSIVTSMSKSIIEDYNCGLFRFRRFLRCRCCCRFCFYAFFALLFASTSRTFARSFLFNFFRFLIYLFCFALF